MQTNNLPSSFASAAAGQNASHGRAGGRDDRGGGGDWIRRDGKSSNGTVTLRRSSSAQVSTLANSEAPLQPSDLSTPSLQSTNPEGSRYRKEDLLTMARNVGDSSQHRSVAELFMAGWQPGSGQVNGASSSHSWGKSSEQAKDVNACWNPSGDTRPISLQEMTQDERDMFRTDVNSTLKPHTQNKDGGQGAGPNGRKASMSHGTGSLYNLSSPTSTRSGGRRRESIDPSPFSAGGLISPTSTRVNRDDPGYWFARKGTDAKDNDGGDDDGHAVGQNKEAQPKTPFGLARSNTAGSTGLGALWSNPATTPGGSSALGGSAMGSFGNFALPTQSSSSKQFGGGGGRGESKFAKLIPQESLENLGGNKMAADGGQSDPSRSWRSRPRTDTDPFGDEGGAGGSSFGGGMPASPPPLPRQQGLSSHETPMKGSGRVGDLGMAGLHIGSQGDQDMPLSPSATNPYGSPPDGHDDDGTHDGMNFDKLRGMGDQGIGSFNGASRGYGGPAFDGSDRSQTSSAGPRSYPPLNAFSGGGGWLSGPAGGATVSTPDRERMGFPATFGGNIFSPSTEGQPGGLGFSSVFGNQPGAGSTASMGRGSKLNSLFPPQMQAQMQGQEPEGLSDSVPDLQQISTPHGAIGRGSIGPGRDTTMLRTGQGVVEEALGASARSMGFGTGDGQPTPIGAMAPGLGFTGAAPGPPFSAATGSETSSTDPPSSQVRTMVMPDRMRWVYLDPQGNIQGPFTGLEMNDWYKAQFFTPDLRVKKLEDKEFEPLGQLIRRIGNSREPFLVPQIGIPHGEPAPSGPFSPAGPAGMLPPLSGVFPTYGRTLTAEEQNNLERRKQEEQLMMAHNREHLMRMSQGSYRGVPAGGVLQHHSSAHSLQSQPSYGSISSPIGMAPQPAAGGPIGTAPGAVPPTPAGYFDPLSAGQPLAAATQPPPPVAMASTMEPFREHELTFAEHQMLAERQMLSGFPSGSGAPGAAASGSGLTAAALLPHDASPAERHSLISQLPSREQLAADPEGFRERLREFDQLRALREAEDNTTASVTSGGLTEDQDVAATGQRSRHMSKDSTRADPFDRDSGPASPGAPSQIGAAAPRAVPGLPMPFPAPERFEDDMSDQVLTPSQPPPLAPWAKETEPQRKGPSLKEIQEAESRKAAQANQAAQAARRAALEKEAAEIREKEKAAATILPGLPMSSTWGQHSPVNTTSPWSKPAAGKTSQATTTAAPGDKKAARKTLAEIQREEEARKQKAKEQAIAMAGPAAAAAAAAAVAAPLSAAGKRYADLASKPNPPPLAHANSSVAAPGAGGWATVGAGGRVKIPTGPAAQARSVSTGNVKLPAGRPAAAPAMVPKPIAGPSVAKNESGNAAMDEFKKWLHREVSRGFNVTNIDDIVVTLMALPLEADTIADAVYSTSDTVNGKHFAEEFIRRMRLAEKGVVVDKLSGGAAADKKGVAGSSGGWSEVAKKGGHATKESPAGGAAADGAGGSAGAGGNLGFKVVPGRNKKKQK